MKFSSYSFPWRIYLRFVVWQTILLSLALIGSLIFWHTCLIPLLPEQSLASGTLDRYLWLYFFLGVIFILFFSLIIGRRFFLPLGRLIQKSRTLLARRESYSREKEEWNELEQVLDRVQSDLTNTSDRLSRGRGEIHTLMSAISDAILAVDEHGEALFYNPQFERQFGVESGSGGVRLMETFRAPDVLESFQQAFRSSNTVSVETALQSRIRGELRDFQLSVAPLRSPTGQVYGVLGIFHDVTELKRAERVRIEFVANASHELRTPLTSIKGYVQTLLQDIQAGRTAGAEKFIQVVARNVDRLMHLVDDLLKLSSLEGEAKIHKQAILTRDLTDTVLKTLEKDKQSKNDEIVVEERAAQVLADAHLLEQVVINLVQNAIKYSPERSRIDVVWRQPVEGGPVELVVRDNGPGIPQKHLPRLFERFYRVDEARARQEGGTGLGLAIVKHIMLRHGGSVRVTSEPGHGTEFVCEFPAS